MNRNSFRYSRAFCQTASVVGLSAAIFSEKQKLQTICGFDFERQQKHFKGLTAISGSEYVEVIRIDK